eukprot:Ihof_evm15s22 gene=Ihof_evmTU15s22
MATVSDVIGDIRRKFELDPASQRQGVQQLFKVLQDERKKQSGPLSSKELPALQSMRKGVSHPSAVVCGSICGGMASLVRCNCIEWGSTVDSLLNQMPSLHTRNLSYACAALVELLSLFAHSLPTDQPCPYGLNATPHPLITAITNRPEAWPYLIGEIAVYFEYAEAESGNNETCWNVRWLEFVLPFFKHILFTRHSADINSLQASQAVQQFLLRLVKEQPDCSMWSLKVLQQILPHLPTSPLSSLGSLNLLLDSLISLLGVNGQIYPLETTDTTDTEEQIHQVKWSIYEYIISLCCQQAEEGVRPFLRLLSRASDNLFGPFTKGSTNGAICQFPPQCRHVTVTTDTLTAMAYLLCGASEEDASIILKVIDKHIDTIQGQSAVTIWGLCSLSFALLSLLSTEKGVGPMAANLLMKVLRLREEGYMCNDNALDEKCLFRPQVMGAYQMIVHTVAQMHQLRQLNLSLLSTVGQQMIAGKPSQVIMMAVGSVLLSPINSARQTALPLLTQLVTIDSLYAPQLLPLLLYQLGREPDPVLRLDILNTIPQLASHRTSLGPVLRAVQAISKGPGLAAMGLRLMKRLWSVQRRVYPYLADMLAETPGVPRSYEYQLARAAVSHSIAMERGEQYGGQIVPWALKTSSNDNDPTVAAMAVDTLTALCKAFVTTVRAVCTALSGASGVNIPGNAQDQLIWLDQETRPLVLANAMTLLSLTPTFSLPDSASLADRCMAEEFKMRVLQKLWGATNNKDERVRKAAFNSLLKFPLADMLDDYEPIISLLIETAQKPTMQKDINGKDYPLCPLPRPCEGAGVDAKKYVQLIMSKANGHLTGCRSLVERALAYELSFASMRKVSSQGAREGHQRTAYYRMLAKVPTILQSAFDSAPTAALRAALGGGLLGVYNVDNAGRGDGQEVQGGVGRKERIQAGRHVRRLFTDMLESPNPLSTGDWHLRLLAVTSWLSFMEQLMKICIPAEIARGELENHNKITVEEAEIVVMDEIIIILQTTSRKSAVCETNTILALGGLALALRGNVQRVHTTVDSIVATLAHMVARILNATCDISGPELPWGIDQGKSNVSVPARFAAAIILGTMGRRLVVHTNRHCQRDLVIYLLHLSRLASTSSSSDATWLGFACNCGVGLLAGGMKANGLTEGRDDGVAGTILMVVEELWSPRLRQTAGPIGLGAYIGLAYCTAALAQEGTLHWRLKRLGEDLMDRFQDTKMDEMCLDGLKVTLSAVCVGSFPHNLLARSSIDEYLQHLLVWPEGQGPSSIGCGVALGNLIHGLFAEGYAWDPSFLPSILTSLKSYIISCSTSDPASQSMDPTVCVPAMVCVACILGIERGGLGGGVVHLSSDSDVGGCGKYVDVLSGYVEDLLYKAGTARTMGDPTIRLYAGWLVGALVGSQLHGRQAGGAFKNGRLVPSSYGHLPKTSLLRALYDALITSKDDDNACAALYILVQTPSLPEVNWATLVLHILAQTREDSEEEKGAYAPIEDTSAGLAVRLLANQASLIGSAAELCVLLCEPSRFCHLPLHAQQTLAKSLLLMMVAVSENLARKTLENICTLLYGPSTKLLSPDRKSAIQPYILDGLLACLQQTDNPLVHSIACSTFPSVFSYYTELFSPIQPPYFPSDAKHTLLKLCECISLLPMHTTQVLLRGKEDGLVNASCATLTCLVRCLLVYKTVRTTLNDASTVPTLGSAWMVECTRQLYPCRAWLLDPRLGGTYTKSSISVATSVVAALTAATALPGGLQIRAKWLTDTLDMTFKLATGIHGDLTDSTDDSIENSTRNGLVLIALCCMAWGDHTTNAFFNPLAYMKTMPVDRSQISLTNEDALAEWICAGGFPLQGSLKMLCHLIPHLLGSVGWAESGIL